MIKQVTDMQKTKINNAVAQTVENTMQTEAPYELPEGWKWCRLGEFIDIFRGVSYKKADAHTEKLENDCLIMRGGNITEGAIDINTDNVYVDKSLVAENQFIKKNDVVIVTSTGSTKVIGRAGVSYSDYDDVAFGAFLTLARPNSKADKQFVDQYFQSSIYRDRIRELAGGVNINNIRMEYITDSPFPLPPTMEEQRRIVKRIESLFAKLDAAKEKAQNVVDSFEVRKAAVLHKAFNGELTASWRKQNGVADDSWEEKSLGDILIEKPRNGYSVVAVDFETPVKSMSLAATTSGYFRPEFVKYIDKDIEDESYLWLKPGDILIQRSNSLDKVGTSAIYTGGYKEFIYPDLMMKLQINEKNLNKFVAYALKTEASMSFFRNNATGTAGNMPKINQKIVCSLPINIPTLPEQQEIVRILDNILQKEQSAKKAAQAVLEQIDLLKKSILTRAFRGEL